MNGFAAAKIIRELGYKNYLFGVTGSSSSNDAELFLSNGVTAVLLKPMSLSVLRQAILRKFL